MPRELTSEQRRALDEFAKTINDRDPREKLLRDASAALREGGVSAMGEQRRGQARAGQDGGLDRRAAASS